MEKLIFTKKEFKEIMEVLKATAKDEARPILQGVNFNNNEVVALDGYRLMLRKIDLQLKGNYTIHRNDLKQVLKAVKRDTEQIEITFNPDVVVFKVDDKEKFVFNVLQGSYINYKSLIPSEFNLMATLEAKKIIESIKLLNKNHYVILDVNKDIIDIKDVYYFRKDKQSMPEAVTGTIVNNFMNCITKGENKKIAFNNTYLKESLKNYKEKIDIKIINGVSPMIVTDNKKKLDLVLPVRLIA